MFDLGNMGDERLAMMAMNAYNNMYTDPISGNLSPNLFAYKLLLLFISLNENLFSKISIKRR